MTAILEWGNHLIVMIQNIGNGLLLPMTIVSFLGTEQFFLLIAPAVYWCIDPSLGIRLGIYLMISAGLNDVFKIICHAPRPYWIDTRIKAFSIESSFGIPSGHSMNSAVIWGTIAASLRKTGVWIGAILLIFLIGTSRLYLGMHFPSDILAGWFLGVLLLFLLLMIEKPIIEWFKANSNVQKILSAFLFSLIIIALGFLGRAILDGWKIPAAWIQNASSATGVIDPINPLDPSGLISSCGALFGLVFGYILLDIKGGFQTTGDFWQKITRFFIGLVGILLLWKGLGSLLPDTIDPISLVLRYIRYTLIGAWVTGGAPWIFIRTGLTKKRE